MHMAGMAAGARDDLDQAVELYEESARLAREHGDTGIVTIAVNNLGTIASYRGDYERALELFEEALAINREGHDRHLVALALLNIGTTTWMLGDVERARELLRDGLAAAREIGQVDLFIGGFAALGVAYARQDPARAARLLGRADALREETAFRDDDAVREARSRRSGSRAAGKAGRGRLRGGVRRRARARARGRARACPPPRLSWTRYPVISAALAPLARARRSRGHSRTLGASECGGIKAEMACSARLVVQAQLVERNAALSRGHGWFVLIAREGQWWKRSGLGTVCDFDGELRFRRSGLTSLFSSLASR